MGIFNRKPKEKRSIEDILKRKDVEENVDEAIDEEYEDDEIAEETSNDENAESQGEIKHEEAKSVKKPKKNIQIESPEEGSFNALTCFGWSETKTPKWLIKCAHFWYGAMSFFWFIFGTLTFAPIIFMQKKVNAVFNDKVKSFIVAAIIYVVFVVLIIVMFATRNADKVQEITDAVGSVGTTALLG